MDSRVSEIVAVLAITFISATIITLLRLLSRRLNRVSLAWDDYFALCGFAISIGWVVVITQWIDYGVGLHIEDVVATKNLTLEETLYQGKVLLFACELLYAFGLFFAKISILSLYWRMFSITNIRIPIQILFGCSFVWITIRIFMGIFHCVPVDAFWDPNAGGYCAIQDKNFFFGTTLVHAAIDICILVLPMVKLYQLQLPLLQRLGIMVMFTFGFFICAAAIRLIVAARVFNDQSIDLTWNISDIVVWATVEVNLINISASLPIIRPACTLIFTCRTPRAGSKGSSAGYLTPSNRTRTKQSIRLDTVSEPSPAYRSGSTHHLADPENGGGRGSLSDFDSHAIDQFVPAGNTYHSTVLGQSGVGNNAELNGDSIHVKKETKVHVLKH
jgi:hypothetical protein